MRYSLINDITYEIRFDELPHEILYNKWYNLWGEMNDTTWITQTM